jgi:translation initiation factor 4E
LSTPLVASSGSGNQNDHANRNFTHSKRHGGDTSSHGKSNPFNNNTLSPAVPSPTAGASNAFGLGSGAFASFGANKMAKTLGASGDSPAAVFKHQSLDSPAQEPTANTSILLSRSNAPVSSLALHEAWVFWFRPPISKSHGYHDYEKTLHPMASFDTVEDFFLVYRHLKRPSGLPLVSDYHIFKKGIRPIWEDGENKLGGKWIVRLKKGVADRYWENLLLAMIGDQFSDARDEVCGAVLSMRSGEDVLSIWTRDESRKVLKIR